MKASMRIRYRLFFPLLAAGILLALLGFIGFAFWVDGDAEAVVLCSLLALLIFVCLFCACNYGMWINEKRVVTIAQDDIRVTDYDTISRICVEFTDDCVTATFILLQQPKFTVIWTDIAGFHWYNRHRIQINRNFVKKSIERLSKCPKVNVKNLCSEK